jgi:hypothetical protein
MAGGMFSASFALVLVPAGVSTKCEHMLGTLNKLRKRADHRTQGRISQLESLLTGFNRGQGIGFAVFGAVINRQQLKVLFAKVWAILVGLYLFLGPLLNPPMPELKDLAVETGTICGGPEWYHADGSCFQLFGDEESGDLPTTWPEAEAHCQQYGANLARITSKAHNDVVVTLCSHTSLGQCWIGLTDSVEEGEFVWSDGEQLEFEAWKPGEPNGFKTVQEEIVCEAARAGPDCVAISRKEWRDFFCEVSQGANAVQELPECSKTQFAFVCSKPAVPGAPELPSLQVPHWYPAIEQILTAFVHVQRSRKVG